MASPWICLLGKINREVVGPRWMRKLVSGEAPEWTEPFVSWLLRRVAHAVVAGEVPAVQLPELQGEFRDVKQRLRFKRRAGTSW
jgi:hypothetical protein